MASIFEATAGSCGPDHWRHCHPGHQQSTAVTLNAESGQITMNWR